MTKVIWQKPYTLEQVRSFTDVNMVKYLGIVLTELGPDFISGTLPVDHRTQQTIGLLHGGASAVLAETLGSIAANLCVDREHFNCVGTNITSNHLRSVTSGTVTGVARPIHRGLSTHLWEIDIHDDKGRLINTSRLSIAVVAKRPSNQQLP